jgi:uncharacterized protein (DUF885 family)
MKSLLAALLFGMLLLASCGDQEPPVAEQASTQDTSMLMAEMFEEYFERELELNPLEATSIGDYRYNDRLANSIGAEYIEATHQLDEEFLNRINEIDRDQLEGQDLLSYDMFKLDREVAIEGEAFPGHLQPMNQFNSMTSDFVRLGSGSGMHPFVTVKDYEDFLSRTDDFVSYIDQSILNMKEGMQQGVVQPRILMAKLVPQLESQIVADPRESGFYTPVANMPDSFNDEDRARLTAEYTEAISSRIIPAFERLNNFFGDEYLDSARESVGMLDLPGGKEWYAYLVRRTTTTNLTPDEIHQVGLAEVERIHGEMRGVMEEVGFDGDLNEFFEFVYADPQFFYDEPEQLIQAYRDMSDHVADLAKALFNTFPITAFEVRRVEPFREASSSKGSYQRGTPDGSRPGIFYANAYNVGVRPKWDMQSLFLHEAIPGHHYQISLQQEASDLPRFRRFGGYTAYIEGWGLYAETLGKELGMYQDPYDYFGALNAQLWRSIRLVVDTGLHAKGWSRQEVLDFMYANSAVSETRAVSEAERFMAIPSQALAYKTGQLKLHEIRNNAEARLGDKFDVQAFHTEILKDGSLPLSMLEIKIDRWVDSQL